MDTSDSAVKEFLSKAGHHDTTVHERVAPAVTHETVKPTQHEDVTTAIDKEIHQDHHHTSVQPITDRVIMPETHKHNLVAVEHREFHHGDTSEVKSRLEREAAQFHDERIVADTVHTHSVQPVIAGEHIHHHVHETIQPVVQRETIQPTVVHTTVPIHEVHHNAAQHHATSALPAVSMADFKKQGGVLTGREERYDGFEGEPRSVGGALGSSGSEGVSSGLTGTSSTSGTTRTRGTSGSTGTGLTSTGLTGTSGTRGTTSGHGSATKTERMENKLDPRVDSDADGKRGVMS